MEKVIIRKATVDDVSAIVMTRLTSASETEIKGFGAPEWIDDWSLVKLRTMWAEENKLKDGSEIVVAEKGGRVVGFIVFKVESDYVYIDDVYVTKDEQRKGIGKSLVEYVEKVAVASRCFCIRTDTTENTEGVPWKSYGFRTRMGYEDTGERLPTKWDFKTIPFVKNLK